MNTIKEALWREIDSLPDSQLETLLEFVQFLNFQKQKDPAPTSRIPGLDTETTWVSDDFDEPLPDSFWLGGETKNKAAS